VKIIYTSLTLVICVVPGLLAQPQPSILQPLRTFNSAPDGALPIQPLVIGADNVLYGSTASGGSSLSYGTIFKINTDGTGYSVLRDFTRGEAPVGSTGGFVPNFGSCLVQGFDGAVYGTSSGGTNHPGGVIFKMNTDGSGFSMIHNFTEEVVTSPRSLIQGRDGMLYAAGGGIWKMDTNGNNFSLLHTFTVGTDGAAPNGKLLHASNGVLYGTTVIGGVSNVGTLFRLNTDGSDFAVVHSFGGVGDGQRPFAGLIEASDGMLYGTTRGGGTNSAGTVFKLDRNGTSYQVLYHFANDGKDGILPYGALVQGANNVLYGTTSSGGANNAGTIFKIGLDLTDYQVLRHLFATANEPRASFSGLVQGATSEGSGILYGVSSAGGPSDAGMVFATIVNPPVSITPTTGQSGGKAAVFWPAWALNYTLQSSTNPDGPWVTETNVVPIVGAQLTNSQPSAYYRLVWPH
jgi:uncharacterized repeat protein (TIGR03803 family)